MGTQERLAVQRAMARDADAITARVVALVLREIPAYGGVSAAQREEIAAIAGWALRRTVELWVDGSVMSDADLRRFRGIGAARAADGRPLQAILRAYRVAAVEAGDLVVERGAGILDVDDLAALNRTMLVGVDSLSEALFAGYTQAASALDEDRERALAGLADDLLAGRQTSRAALADRAARLGITLPSRFTLTVTSAPDGPSAAVPRAAGSVATLLTRRGDLTVVLGPEPSPVPSGARGAVVTDVAVARLPRTYRLVVHALDHAPSRAFGSSPVLDRADVLALAVLRGADADSAEELASAALGPLLDPAHAHLLEGLLGYLDHGSATGAAQALGLHPQSVRHRLRRMRELTGRDLDDPWDRLVLDMARTSPGPVPDR
ncbi:PucR family transcriptional regulator [Mumia zhuanghuii]|uniref:PucR family transcriptional regulator n=1 Tax=Mumia zhuanghuii TaxID=2585211 RepID=A0A5C4MHQ2_9ACTN|nr:helix-turn-helix domain-containing protein [Mumia zhuanghuii]TNC40505.1 PucR family transcriptional regulator [Mumia zhuanghuii]TNC46296.1 PucR family transcriptional regulator [Mumia zhuanghuii]